MSTLQLLEIGDDAVCTATFAVGGVATNPTAVTWYVWPPGATSPDTYVAGTDPEATNPSTGTHRLQVPVTLSGRHQVKVVGTGTAKGAMLGEYYGRHDPGT